jgi:rod shape-determining protein MreD
MALTARRTDFTPPPSGFLQLAIPAASVMIASLMTLLPYIATAPLMPPFGFLMMLSWRLLRNDLWPVWAALPLGLFDDMFSGSPIGTAMALWTMTFIAIDLIDRRFVWRDHWQDWSIAAAAISLYLIGALAIETMTGGGTPVFMLTPQVVFSILVFPLMSRIAAGLDRLRLGR